MINLPTKNDDFEIMEEPFWENSLCIDQSAMTSLGVK